MTNWKPSRRINQFHVLLFLWTKMLDTIPMKIKAIHIYNLTQRIPFKSLNTSLTPQIKRSL